MSIRSSLGGAALLIAVAATGLHAQSNVSTQGFGYPPGQLSTASLGSAGALSEFDPVSTLNPAAVADWGRAGLHFQTDPEFRTVTSPGGIDHTTTLRFPLLVAGLPITSSFAMALSFSTLLDRTWETRVADTVAVGDTMLLASNDFKSTGGIEDLGIAAGWAPSSALRLGLGLHFFTGQNQITVTQTFPTILGTNPISKTAPFGQADLYNYSGFGVSAGIELRPTQTLAFAASGRFGGQLLLRRRDTTETTGTVPPRLGAGIRFDGIRGIQIGLNADWEGMVPNGRPWRAWTRAPRFVDVWSGCKRGRPEGRRRFAPDPPPGRGNADTAISRGQHIGS